MSATLNYVTYRWLVDEPDTALFRTLVAAEGATVARAVLAAAAPEPLDDHAVDVAISRLRQALPEPRLVATVIKRGFRLATPL